MATLTPRFRKQALIGVVTLAAFGIVSLAVFAFSLAGDEGDHVLIRYAEENGMDSAQDISGLEAREQYILGEQKERSLVAVLHNPNEGWHASRVSYRFSIKGAEEREEVVEGSSFVGAASDRLIVEQFSSDFSIESFSFTIESVDWVSAPERQLAELRVRQAVFETKGEGHGIVSHVSGRVVNDSAVGAVDVEVGIVARTQEGVAVGAGVVDVASLNPAASEELSFSWEGGLGNVATLSFFPVAEGISKP